MSVIYAAAAILQALLALILLPILGTLVSSGKSENLRFPWAVMVPSNCRNATTGASTVNLPQFRNNSFILNPEGWNLYPMFGVMCPGTGIISKYSANSITPTSRRHLTASYSGGPKLSGAGAPEYTYTYSGCIQFTDKIWATMDAQNLKAGYRTNLAADAAATGSFFGPLMVAAVVFFWLFGMVGVFVSTFVHVFYGTCMAVFGYSFAWALWLSAYVQVHPLSFFVLILICRFRYSLRCVQLISTDLVVGNSYVNSFFHTCSVNIQWGHGAVVHVVVLFIGGAVLVSPFALYMVYMCAQPAPGSFLHPGFKEPSAAARKRREDKDEEEGVPGDEEGKGGEEEPVPVPLVEKPRSLRHFHSTLVGGDHLATIARYPSQEQDIICHVVF